MRSSVQTFRSFWSFSNPCQLNAMVERTLDLHHCFCVTMTLHLFQISHLEFINEICKSEFGNDVFMQDDCSYSKGHVVEIAKIQTWMNRH